MQRQLNAVMEGYSQFRELDAAELWLIEALRTLRLIHYARWLAQRWDDPAFPRSFRKESTASDATAPAPVTSR